MPSQCIIEANDISSYIAQKNAEDNFHHKKNLIKNFVHGFLKYLKHQKEEICEIFQKTLPKISKKQQAVYFKKFMYCYKPQRNKIYNFRQFKKLFLPQHQPFYLRKNNQKQEKISRNECSYKKISSKQYHYQQYQKFFGDYIQKDYSNNFNSEEFEKNQVYQTSIVISGENQNKCLDSFNEQQYQLGSEYQSQIDVEEQQNFQQINKFPMEKILGSENNLLQQKQEQNINNINNINNKINDEKQYYEEQYNQKKSQNMINSNMELECQYQNQQSQNESKSGQNNSINSNNSNNDNNKNKSISRSQTENQKNSSSQNGSNLSTNDRSSSSSSQNIKSYKIKKHDLNEVSLKNVEKYILRIQALKFYRREMHQYFVTCSKISKPYEQLKFKSYILDKLKIK
ncbi:hypothetical protein PPERSA_02763 [Pseudocohnilembus persalinus]|uniref:Uncharacterized protein n=1 Tax=Pseudocohnilembus persalinus TaxID=266149 RepID=A0A0V0Q9B5_PSEPJ|nr:hypothetical protein PPERSA_02763 [Pseudocohnilembus persalinus]|eukprot:KRW98615.1 hypothetical protein PPERSA_02763 [Pseudocohnilembus persalinus]